ncbi:MAG: hypothetical protein GTO24_15535 [candidate division Zixibacteria bacterium]|nr:hypothetical protein [candidate division Zixibacteria bacterium]
MRRRYLQTAVFFLLSVFVFAPQLQGKTLIENKRESFSFENSFAKGEFEHSQKIFELAHASFLAYQSDSMQEEEMADVYGFKGKSLKRAFLYSLIIPGSGELYAGSKIKAALFLGVDITLWALYFNYHGKGKDKENEYKAFADGHWSEDDYKQWLYDSVYVQEIPYDIVSDTFAYRDTVRHEWVYFSHHLPDKKNQQYYEMIGKYEQFRWGWDDFDGLILPSPNWDNYRNLRGISNDWLNKAKYSAMFSLANHILSAFDAAIAVKRYNKKGERFSQIQFKTRLVERDREIIPRLSASLRF